MIIVPQETDTRTRTQQYWDGFATFCECDRSGEYLSAGELAALTPAEMRGYNAAVRAKDEAATPHYAERMGF